jgi:CheY-like chemotaxis protein
MSTVLLVDDEPEVRLLAARFLDGHYQVRQAKDGLQAWLEFRRRPFDVDVLVTDVVMPGLSGTELAARVHQVRPDLPIVLMTGYSPAELLARGLEVSHGRILTKPFSQEELLARVGEALGVKP